MVFDPALVKELFQGPDEQLHAGEANALLGPILGQRSVLLLDGAEHLRHRRLMLRPVPRPPDAGLRRRDAWLDRPRDRLVAGRRAVRAAPKHAVADAARDPPRGVRLRAGRRGGGAPPAAARDDRAAGAAAGDDAAAALPFARGDRAAATRQFETRARAVDEVLYAEIARRRADPDRSISATTSSRRCCSPRTRTAQRLSDARGPRRAPDAAAGRARDDRHRPRVDLRPAAPRRRRCSTARASATSAYLDAVVKESLRVRPVIPGVGRVVRGEPFRLNGYVIPPGVEINPSIRMIHRRDDLYPDADGVPARAVPRRGPARHLHLDPVRRRHAPLPRRELRADGDADRDRPRARARRCCGPPIPSTTRSSSAGSRWRRGTACGSSRTGPRPPLKMPARGDRYYLLRCQSTQTATEFAVRCK